MAGVLRMSHKPQTWIFSRLQSWKLGTVDNQELQSVYSCSRHLSTRPLAYPEATGPSFTRKDGNDEQHFFRNRLTDLTTFLKRDLAMVKVFVGVHANFFKYAKGRHTVVSLFRKTAKDQPDKVAIVTEDSHMTCQQLEDYSNRVADAFRSSTLQKKDVVALFGTSSAQYVGIWLGLAKLEVRTALLNSNLLAETLMHSVKAASAQTIVVDTDLLSQFESIRERFPDDKVYYYNSNPAAEKPSSVSAERWLNALVEKASPAAHPYTNTDLSDVLLYVYTSGTTGLPKASIITQRRFLAFSVIIKLCGGLRRDDVIYCPLPLYHTAAGIGTVGQTLIHGSTIVIRKKFSAKQFWTDVVRHKCTVVQYIGEICRFLLAQPPNELEKQHHLRLAFGQGLRLALWEEFRDRFRISDVRDMYGSTEGNAGMANVHGKPGAMGYLSPLLGRLVAAPAIILIDKETGEFLGKQENGFYRQVTPGEEGELLGPVTSDPLRRYEGYTDDKATSSKIVKNVFRKGDSYFRTGDIVSRDKEGFVFFVDRFGDSYRWKGENVSTTEVEGVISKLCDYADVVVYGVDVPGSDGKAGMLCIAADATNVDLSQLYESFVRHLPSYSVPVFIRFSKALDLTGTFKIPKSRLKTEGYSLDKMNGDKVFFLDHETKSYKLLTIDVYQSVLNGQMRF